MQDDSSGLEQGSIGNTHNHAFAKMLTHVPREFGIVSATVAENEGPTQPQTVVLGIGGGRNLKRGTYLFAALSGGIMDVAGNDLDGLGFTGALPSGDGLPDSNFLAEFHVDGRDIADPLPTTQFIPIINFSPGGVPRISVSLGSTPTRGGQNPLTSQSTQSTKAVQSTKTKVVTKITTGHKTPKAVTKITHKPMLKKTK